MVALKIFCLFVGIMFTFVNVQRGFYKTNIPGINYAIQAASIAGFIYLQWLA